MTANRGAMKFMRWLNAGFLILAACRALVPGLCATQLAAKDATEYRAAHSCCSTRQAAPSEGPGVRAPQPERAPCGFCNVSQGMVDPLIPAVFTAPAIAGYSQPAYQDLLLLAAIAAPHDGRAPPDSFQRLFAIL